MDPGNDGRWEERTRKGTGGRQSLQMRWPEKASLRRRHLSRGLKEEREGGRQGECWVRGQQRQGRAGRAPLLPEALRPGQDPERLRSVPVAKWSPAFAEDPSAREITSSGRSCSHL